MEIKQLYREIVNEHNLHPANKRDLEGATIVLEGVNPSCGDDIYLQLKVEDGVITDAAFNGSGCAISQASADIMIDLVLDRTLEEAMELAASFMGMIKGTASEEEIEELDEAAALQDIAHMPARVKCAVLGWRTMKQMIETLGSQAASENKAKLCPSGCRNTDCDRRV